MRTHTQGFKEQIKKMGREIDSIITYGDTVLSKEQLYAVTPSFQGGILKSVMKQLEIDSSTLIPIGTILNYKFGVKVNGEYEYLNFGNYIVKDIEKQENTNSYRITCYDKMLLSMKDYVSLPITYPITVREYIDAISTFLGLTFVDKNKEFANYNKQIQGDLYLGLGYTFRDVLDELAQVTASTICINDDDELEIRYITETGDTIDEEFLKDVNVNFGEKFGPANTIVLSRSGGSDKIYKTYPENLPEHERKNIEITDNQIMNDNDRADFLPDILEKLNGLEFYTNDFVSTGICYLELGDRYNVKIGENVYSCVMLNNEVLVTQGLQENVYTELPEQTETDYKRASKDDRKINKTYIIADKQNQKIEALTSAVATLDTTVNNNYQEINKKFDDYVPENEFVTLENSVTQLQTDTYTKTEINTKLTDGSVTKVKTTSLTADDNGLTVDKNDSKTKGNLDSDGLTVIDKTGASESELLFAGYDETLGETIVRTNNIRIIKYTDIGTHSRIQDYEDGTGIFILQ